MVEPTTTHAAADSAENGAGAAEPKPAEGSPAQEQPTVAPDLPAPQATAEVCTGSDDSAASQPLEVVPGDTAIERGPAAPAEEPKKETKKRSRKEPVAADAVEAVPAATTAEEQPPPPEEPAAPAAVSNKHWYVVKVQSGREESIKEAIERRVKIEGLEEYFGRIIIPVERVTELGKNNKRIIKERKLYPGYLMVEVEYNDRMLYLFRETSGVGDFVGGGINHPPQPMKQKEIDRILGAIPERPDVVSAKPKFDRGDRVRVRDGTFAGMEGEVKDLLEAKGAVKVELTIFGRPVPVELEYWQVEETS